MLRNISNNPILKALGYVLLSLAPLFLQAQASNDAGIGRLGGLGLWEEGTDMPTSLYVTETFGLDQQRTLHYTTCLEFTWNMWTWINLQVRLPYEVSSGDFGTFHGLGDMEIFLTHTMVDNDRIFLKVYAGGRLPANDADKTLYGLGVPMSYQTSLGVYDFLAGLSLFVKTWEIAAGYQHPFGSNKNTFVHDEWTGDGDQNIQVWDYPESPYLRRGDDVALRLQKRFVRPKSTFIVGILPIYRIQYDKILKDGVEENVSGSMGLTLNIQAGWKVRIGKSGAFRLMAGFPVVSRETSADGLQRSVAAQAGLGYHFP